MHGKALSGLLTGGFCLLYSTLGHTEWQDLYHKGKPVIDGRIRYETVSTDNRIEDANAVTTRLRLGYVTGEHAGFSGMIEGAFNTALLEDFNSTRNGETAYNVVPDPYNLRIDKLWLRYHQPKVDFILGRQPINLDNQRFVGAVAWRQNDQTFDAARLSFIPFNKTEVFYSYLHRVNTIWGSDDARPSANNAIQPPNEKIRSNLIQLRYAHSPAMNAVLYGYLLDLDGWDLTLKAGYGSQSSQTYGLRLTGKVKRIPLGYEAEYASQSDYASQPLSYDANYYHVAAKYTPDHQFLPAILRTTDIGLGYEALGTDQGKIGFQTPLGTKHKFNGWADKFLITPKDGLRDFYVKGRIPVKKVEFAAEIHQFRSDTQNSVYGNEWGISAGFPLPLKGVSTLIKYADYRKDEQNLFTAAAGNVDTQKFWIQMDYVF